MVEREHERAAMRRAAPAQLLAHRLLDAGKPAIVHVGETDRVGEETALGVDPLFLTLQPETGNAQPVDGMRLLGREVVPQQGGLPAGGDEGGRAIEVQIGEDATERGNGRVAIHDLVGLDVERMCGQVRGQEDAVAVYDVSPRNRVEGACATGAGGTGGPADHRHVEGYAPPAR